MEDNKEEVYDSIITKPGATGERQRALIKLLHNNKRISNHLVIIQELESIGVYCSQASISRDLKELNITKSEDGTYQVDDFLADKVNEQALESILRASNAVRYSEVLTYAINVAEGYEKLVSKQLKETYYGLISATICGDGVIMMFFSDTKAHNYVVKRLELLSPMYFESTS